MIKAKQILIFIGPPGSGKGLHSQWLVQKYHFGYVAAGDLCRQHLQYFDSVNQKTIGEIIASGQMVSSELIGKLIVEAIDQQKDTSKTIIIDGFPRNLEQYAHWLKLVQKHNWQIILFNLHASTPTIMQRINNRLICPQCGLTFNRSLHSPKLDQCPNDSVQLVKRGDDLQIKKRLLVFAKHTQPVIQHFAQNKDVLIFTFNTNNNSLVKLHKQMMNVLQKHQWI